MGAGFWSYFTFSRAKRGGFKEHFTTTQVLAASLRSVEGVEDCFGFGTDVVTMPPEIFEGMYKHFLTDQGLDKFDQDWKTATTQ